MDEATLDSELLGTLESCQHLITQKENLPTNLPSIYQLWSQPSFRTTKMKTFIKSMPLNLCPTKKNRNQVWSLSLKFYSNFNFNFNTLKSVKCAVARTFVPDLENPQILTTFWQNPANTGALVEGNAEDKNTQKGKRDRESSDAWTSSWARSHSASCGAGITLKLPHWHWAGEGMAARMWRNL